MAPTSNSRPTPPRIAARGGPFFEPPAPRDAASVGGGCAGRTAGGRDWVVTGVWRRVTSGDPITTVGPGGGAGGRAAAGRGVICRAGGAAGLSMTVLASGSAAAGAAAAAGWAEPRAAAAGAAGPATGVIRRGVGTAPRTTVAPSAVDGGAAGGAAGAGDRPGGTGISSARIGLKLTVCGLSSSGGFCSGTGGSVLAAATRTARGIPGGAGGGPGRGTGGGVSSMPGADTVASWDPAPTPRIPSAMALAETATVCPRRPRAR